MKRIRMATAAVVITGILMTSGAWAQSITPSTTLERRMAALEATVRTLQSQVSTLQNADAGLQNTVKQQHSQITALQDANTTLQNSVKQQQNQITTLNSQVVSLQNLVNSQNNVLKYLSIQNGDISGLKGPHVIFTGVNVHIRSGSGQTRDNDKPLGLGNLIVGYNELAGTLPRTGSHNLVVGPEHSYTSTGGFVAGLHNSVSGLFSSVSGGASNKAEGAYNSISGGQGNRTSYDAATVSGGLQNTASGNWSTVSGGQLNTASTNYTTVSGGKQKTASVFNAWAGGDYHTP